MAEGGAQEGFWNSGPGFLWGQDSGCYGKSQGKTSRITDEAHGPGTVRRAKRAAKIYRFQKFCVYFRHFPKTPDVASWLNEARRKRASGASRKFSPFLPKKTDFIKFYESNPKKSRFPWILPQKVEKFRLTLKKSRSWLNPLLHSWVERNTFTFLGWSHTPWTILCVLSWRLIWLRNNRPDAWSTTISSTNHLDVGSYEMFYTRQQPTFKIGQVIFH